MNKKISIYQVLPRLFGNQNKTPKYNGNIQENGCGKMNDFTPKALQEIKRLGVNHIWYTGIIRHGTTTEYPGIPVQDPCIIKGKAGSPYAIVDYYDVHPDLAEDVNKRMQEFENLVKRSHDENLKVIIDFVPNHVGRDYKSLMQPKGTPDLGENDDSSSTFHPQNNFYYLPHEKLTLSFCEEQQFEEFPAKVTGDDCFSSFPGINNWYETIKLNYGIDFSNGRQKRFDPIPATWTRMLEILTYWTNKGIDGFRCDMVEMVPVEFWAWVIPQIKAINPELIFIAEVYQPHLYHEYIKTGKFDYLYDKVGLYDMLKAVLRGEKPASILSDSWKSLNGLDKHMLRFLENHDEQRIATPEFASDAKKAIPAMMLSATIHQGPIMTYFGQEFGENNTASTGFSGDDARTTIFDYWNIPTIQRWRGKSAFSGSALSSEEKILQSEYKKILKLSTSHPGISNGEFYDLCWANKDNHLFYHNYIFAYFRNFKDKALLFVLNFSDQQLNQKVIIPGHALEFAEKDTTKLKDKIFKNYFTKESIRISHYDLVQTGLAVKINPWHYQVFEF
jgi:glycosidase